MLDFIFKQIPYIFSFKKQILIGTFLGGITAFIMIALQPFGTYEFESNLKYFIFSGFGIIIFFTYLFCGRMENLFYNSKNKRWEIRYEIVFFIGFTFLSSLSIHFYNQIFLNDLLSHDFLVFEYIKHGIWFFWHSIIPVILLLLPFYVYFRNRFGELITSEHLSEIEFFGLNKGEKIMIQKTSVLFVKASENYVEIFYSKNETIQYETFRNTLSAINIQASFLHQCHRSYLVNLTTIKNVKGNSQNGKIEFHYDGLNIPLSKSYYNSIKSAL